MATVSLQEAQAKLPDLIHSLAPGEELVIIENELPIARLIAAAAPTRQRKLGTLRGSVTYIAADFDAPLEDFREHME